MAGMLPGVEAARRRDFTIRTQRGDPPSVYMQLAIMITRISLQTPHQWNSGGQVTLCDESKLCAEAREAKKRLDERLQPQWRSTATGEGDEGTKWKKNSRKKKKRLNWLKLRWKSSEEEECAVCLEQLMKGENEIKQMQLPCGHSFHTNCLSPWLETNARCPCCRMEIHPA